MTKLQDAWNRVLLSGLIKDYEAMEDAITEAEAEIERLNMALQQRNAMCVRLTRERDDARQHVKEWEEHAGPYYQAEIERLTSERDEALAKVDLYREAVRIDVLMEGPHFMGCNTSALKRAWEYDIAHTAAKGGDA